MAALRWPGPCQQPGDLRGLPHVAWSDCTEQPGPRGKARRHPVWPEGEEVKDGDSSVSSGRLSGSSGGHESCASSAGPWRERPPQVLGPRPQPRESNPRLELLLDKIRAQAQWQASCASLGPSALSSSSRLSGVSRPDARRKAEKPKKPTPAPWEALRPRASVKGLGALSVAPCGVEDKAIPSPGCEPSRVPRPQASVPREKAKRMQSGPCRREKIPRAPLPRRAAKDKGGRRTVGAAESPRMPSATSVRRDPPLSANAPSLASCDPPMTIQNAMAILRDLRQQIQAGLELARHRHPSGGLEPGRSKPWLQDVAGRRPWGPWSTPDVQGSFSKIPQGGLEGRHPSLESAGGFPTGRRWGALAGREPYPQKTGLARGGNPSFRGPGSPSERLTSLPQRPWSVSAGQASRPQWAWATYEDAETPAPRSWIPSGLRSWSASFPQGMSTLCKARDSLLPPSAVGRSWLRTAGGAPGKENEARVPPPCPKPREALGHSYSADALRDFMRQARRRQALEEKVSAVRVMELRNQGLRDAYRKQRDTVLGKAVPVVSQTTPGIVTFFPHCAQSRGLESPGSLGPPVLEWSKVTSGMVLGDQEAPGSFCLCLNRALNRAETLERGGPQDGWDSATMLMSTCSSPGPLKLQDLTTRPACPGVCIYLDPEESERLGTPGPLHFRYKQARLQALETMANILKQRIDILTASLRGPGAPGAVGDPAPDLQPSRHGPVPTAPVCSRALVPNGSRGAPWDGADMPASTLVSPTRFLEPRLLPWSPDWERRQSVSPRGRHDSEPQGLTEDGRLELENRLARNAASFQALGPFIGSSLRAPAVPGSTRDSLQLDDLPAASGAGLVPPWTMRGCGQCSGYLASIPRRSPSSLKSLQLEQEKQERVLALLRQRAELEVWETQKALDQLLFKHQLEHLMGKHSSQARPERALARKQPRVCRALEPTASPSAEAASPRSQPAQDRDAGTPSQGPQEGQQSQEDKSPVLPPSPRRSQPAQGRDAGMPSQGPQEGQQSQENKSASAEPRQEVRPDQAPSQLPPARLYPRVNPTHQRSLDVAGAPGRFTLQMLELSLREEELRANHQTALLRLREKALEEKMRAELAWLEQQRGCLRSRGNAAVLAALAERQKQALSSLEQEQREIRCLRNAHLFSHKERRLLLQHQRDILSLRMAVAQLQQELEARTGLPQRCGPEVKPAQTEGLARGPLCPWTPRGPGSPGPGRSPGSPPAQHLPTGQEDGTPPQDTAAADSHWPPRPVWGQDAAVAGGWPDVGARLAESPSPVRQGDPQPNPHHFLSEKTRRLMESSAQKRQGQHSPGDGGPCAPLEAGQVAEGRVSSAGSELELVFGSSPREEPHKTESRSSGEQRMETCWQEDTPEPFSRPEAALLTATPGDSPTKPPPAQGTGNSPSSVRGSLLPEPQGGALPAAALPARPPRRRQVALGRSPAQSVCASSTQTTTAPVPPSLRAGSPLGLGPESESESGPQSSAESRAASSGSGLSCRSLQEFRKVSARLVQLSESSVSLSDWEARCPPDADPGWCGELSPQDSWGLHQAGGQLAWERLEGSGAGPQRGSPRDAGGPEPGGGLLRAGQLLPVPGAPSSRSGSELSEASSEVWDEENLLGPGPGADPASGCSSSAGGSSHMEGGGAPCSAPPSLGLGEGQEASGTSRSLSSELNTERAKQVSPGAAPVPPTASPSSDLDLPLSSPSGSLASDGADFGKGGDAGPLQASAGCPEGPGDVDLSLSNHRDAQQAWPELEVPVSPRAPPGGPGGLVARTPEGGVPGCRGRGDSPAPEEACPSLAGAVLPEILSPVDDVLSYGSANLPSSTHRDAGPPPLPPTLPAQSEATSLRSEDFPPPPEDAMSIGGSLGPPGEDTSIEAGELPSLSEEGLPESPSPGPQEAGPCPGAGRQAGSLGDTLCSEGGARAAGSQWPEPALCLGSPLCAGAGGATGGLTSLPVRPPTGSRVAYVAGEGLPMSLAARGTEPSGTGRGDPAPAPGTGPRTDAPGVERAEAMDLVSSQLTRRILCDTLAALSELAQPSAR